MHKTLHFLLILTFAMSTVALSSPEKESHTSPISLHLSELRSSPDASIKEAFRLYDSGMSDILSILEAEEKAIRSKLSEPGLSKRAKKKLSNSLKKNLDFQRDIKEAQSKQGF